MPSYTLLHHLPPAISRILGSLLNTLCFISPHFVTDPGDIVNLKYDILSTIYSQGQRLALKQGRSLHPSCVFTAQFIQIDNCEGEDVTGNQVPE